MQLVDGLIRVVVRPSSEEYDFEWKLNGEIVAGENDPTFALPLNITGNDQVEIIISSDCGATARANILVLTYYISTPTIASQVVTIGKCTKSYSMS